MTYEMAVAQAMLNVYNVSTRPGWWGEIFRVNRVEQIFALRRLRVRAGLTP